MKNEYFHIYALERIRNNFINKMAYFYHVTYEKSIVKILGVEPIIVKYSQIGMLICHQDRF